MKKVLIILAAVLLLFAAFQIRPRNEADPVPQTQPTTPATSEATSEATSGTTSEPTSQPTETTAPPEISLPLPQEAMEFSFLSGAGGWRTVMTLHRDGTFTGEYSDSEMGDRGDDYPYGSIYICNFSGRFEVVEQLNDYAYKITLAYVDTEKPLGEEWIEESIRYVASAAHGLADPDTGIPCTDFILYLPDTPVDTLSEDFLIWWPYHFSQNTDAKDTLSCYGILNESTGFGFFTYE